MFELKLKFSPILFIFNLFTFIANKLSRTESSPRRFGGLLPSSRSHDEDIDKHSKKMINKKTDSPIRRSILETNEADDSSAAEDIEERSRAKKSSVPKREEYGQIQLTISYDTTKNKLLVKVNQANGLINTDKDSQSDPYARVLILPDRKKRTKRKTKIIKDNLAPVWDEQFDYDIPLADAKTKTIDLMVKNDKSLFSREKVFMGQCLIPLESIANIENGHTDWYKLQDQSVFEPLIKKLNE